MTASAFTRAARHLAIQKTCPRCGRLADVGSHPELAASAAVREGSETIFIAACAEPGCERVMIHVSAGDVLRASPPGQIQP